MWKSFEVQCFKRFPDPIIDGINVCNEVLSVNHLLNRIIIRITVALKTILTLSRIRRAQAASPCPYVRIFMLVISGREHDSKHLKICSVSLSTKLQACFLTSNAEGD